MAAPVGLGWITAAIGLVTTVVGGLLSSRQAKKQNAANQESAKQAIEYQKLKNQEASYQLDLLKQQQAYADAKAKEMEKKIIKYGSIIATGVIIYQMIKD